MQALVTLGRFPAVDAPARQRFDKVMAGGQSRAALVSPAWLGRPVVTMGCVATSDDEAFSSVKSMIMRRASNAALVAVEDVERMDVLRLADW